MSNIQLKSNVTVMRDFDKYAGKACNEILMATKDISFHIVATITEFAEGHQGLETKKFNKQVTIAALKNPQVPSVSMYLTQKI